MVFKNPLRFIIRVTKVIFRLAGQGRLKRAAYHSIRVIKDNGIIALCKQGYIYLKSGMDYSDWVVKHDVISKSDRCLMQEKIEKFSYMPLISILMPVYNAPQDHFMSAIDSVKRQAYTNWELCIADDASTEPHVHNMLEELRLSDSRVKVVYRKSNGHISAASNSALNLVTGDFVALLDHDDELSEHALYMVVDAINKKPYVDMIYSDEDKIDESGRRFLPYFKPDWNPDLLMAQNVVSHLGVYRASVMREVGGFREGFEGSQDWDLALRVSEVISAKHIHHIPHILYHWRAVKGSTAASINAKPYVTAAAIPAVREHLSRTERTATVSMATDIYLRVSYTLTGNNPLVSIVIRAREDLKSLRRCIDSVVNKTSYPAFEILVLSSQSEEPRIVGYLNYVQKKGVAKIVHYEEGDNNSALNNHAVKYARGDVLCFIDSEIEAYSERWLEELVSQAVRPEIGVVGPMLYDPSGYIQHAGISMGLCGVAGRPYYRAPKGSSGHNGRARLVQNLSALTLECLAVQRAIYEKVKGMDEVATPEVFSDVDFCLRVMEHGYRNLWTPFSELTCHKSVSRCIGEAHERSESLEREIKYMQTHWGKLIDKDPAFNPNLTLENSWPFLAKYPRDPWLKGREDA